MAFFLVPVAFFAVSGAAGAKGAYDSYQANAVRAKAASRNADAQMRLDRAMARTEAAVGKTKGDIARLTLVRLSALEQLDEVVVWLQAGSVEDLDIQGLPDSKQPDLAEWTKTGVAASRSLGDLATAAAGGAAARSAAMAAAGWGSASTGAAISGLSGAALRNATLAWLGGGALSAGGGGMALGATVLSSLNAGFGALGVGFTLRRAAASYDTSSKDFAAKVDTEVKNQKHVRRGLHAISDRSHQLRRALNPIAAKIRQLLEDGDPTDPAQWTAMVGLAKALSRLARYEVMDEAGALAEGWNNPYQELGPLDLESSDTDYIHLEQGISA